MNVSQIKQNNGSVLVVTLIFIVAVAATLYGYFSVIENSGQNVARSQRWNAALSLAESGIEEGLAHLNSGTSLSADGWSQSGSYYTLSRSLGNGKYSISMLPGTNQTATIYATGYVSVAVSGVILSRAVKVNAGRKGLFNVGLGAVSDINLNGHTIASSSYNSYNPLESLGGIYNGFIGLNGDVASEGGILNIGSQSIYGDVYLGPNATYKLAGKGSVTGTIYTDWNVQFPDAELPKFDTNGNTIVWQASPSSGDTNYYTTSGYYIVNNDNNIRVAPGVTVTLDVKIDSYVPEGLYIDGGTTNAGTVFMYQESGKVTLSGNANGGAINNRPQNFILYGLPDVTSITLGGDSDFVGCIYAPEAVINLNGGGTTYNIMGSLIGYSIQMNGHYVVHYDESLAAYGPRRPYVPTSWQEL